MTTIDTDQLHDVSGGARVYMKSNDWQLQMGLQTLKSSLDSVAANNNNQNQLPLMMAAMMMMRR